MLSVLRISAVMLGFTLFSAPGDAPAGSGKGPWNVNSVIIEHACAQTVWNGADAIAVYLTIHNLSSGDDHIVAVASPAARTTAVHEVKVLNGRAERALLPGGLRLKYHQQIAMQPNAEHVLLEELTVPASRGAMLPRSVVLLNAGTLEFEVPINGCGGKLPKLTHVGH